MRVIGKGRKEGCTPLTKNARCAHQAWPKEPVRREASALFPNVHGGRLSADRVPSLQAKYVRVASEMCPSLKSKRVSPSQTEFQLVEIATDHSKGMKIVTFPNSIWGPFLRWWGD